MTKNAETEGQAVYSKWVLFIYDIFVLWYNNNWVWKCPTPVILQHYNQHISGNHLDVGVGTGYYMAHCQFPTVNPKVALMDLNRNCLDAAAKRIQNYQPVTYQVSALDQLDTNHQFDSIGLSYLIHCLPGIIESKSIVFENLKHNLRDGGTLFGVTLLHDGNGIQRNWQAKLQMKYFNWKGIFHNTNDTLDGLKNVLNKHFSHYEIRVVGCAALFVAKK